MGVPFDLISPMVAWVEQGTPPDKVIVSQSDQGKVVRTRPVFPYPMRAQYTKSGSSDDAANFVGVMPSPVPNDDLDWVGKVLFRTQR